MKPSACSLTFSLEFVHHNMTFVRIMRNIRTRKKRGQNYLQYVLAAHGRGWSEGGVRSGVVMDQLSPRRPYFGEI
jgi:hypothetical protein